MRTPGVAGAAFRSTAELAEVVSRLGAEISAAHPEGVVLIGVLKGGAIFMADLLRNISVTCSIDFLELSRYAEGAAKVRLAKDLDLDVTGRDTVIVVELMDSGLTVNYVKRLLAERSARRVSVCALLDRRRRRVVPVEVAFKGIEVDDDYLVGYGLDFEEQFRGLPYLMTVDRHQLAKAPEIPAIAGADEKIPL